ncbi:MAG: Ig-like domain-containing protein [Candidatus Margulisiibacteriota bacterium]
MAMTLGVVMSGCSQTMPEIKSAASTPQNLVCKGIVYGNYYLPESSYYDSHVIGPVAGAVVCLVGSYETKSAVTNDKGEYVFENIKSGDFQLEATKEGYQMGEGYLSTNYLVVAPDGTIFTADLDMFANPVMRSVLPLPNSTIETTAVFTITFNKPMDTATIRPRIISAGTRTAAVGDTTNVTSAWSNGDTVLAVTPSLPLLPNQVYLLYLATAFDQVKDKDGNMLASATSTSYGVPVEEHGDVIENNDYFTYKTSTGGAPGAPGSILVTASSKPFSSDAAVGADFADILGSATIGLNWTAGSGNLTGYKVYVSDSSTNNYRLLEQSSAPTTYTPNVYFTTTMTKILSALYGTTYIDPIGSANYPMINRSTYFKVVAFNGEYESASAEASAIDLVGPRVITQAYSGRTGGGFTAAVLSNKYPLPTLTAGTDTKVAYITFREPLDSSTVKAANFTSTAGTVTDATLLTNASIDLDPAAFWTGSAYSIVKITVDTAFVATQIITVGTGVKDLSGNAASGAGEATIQ